MNSSTLSRVQKSTQKLAELLGGLLFAALGLHLMIQAVGDARARRAPPPPHVAMPEEQPEALPSRPPAAVPPLAARVHRDPSDAAPLRLMLSVLAGPERSEVYVNGSRVGYSPYLGDLSCKSGEKLRIEIVPQKAPLIARTATCEGTTLLIR
jgi:hypothetical protein